MIPPLSESGEKTGDMVRISQIETRVGDRGEAAMVIRWAADIIITKQNSLSYRIST